MKPWVISVKPALFLKNSAANRGFVKKTENIMTAMANANIILADVEL